MADIRPKDLLSTAEHPAADDYLLLDGATEGTRKIPATAIARANGYSECVDNFGATGDGTTEDTAAIEAALAAADVVYFKPGKTYITDSIEIPSNKTIFGYGATLKLKAFNGSAGNLKSVLYNLNGSNINIYGLRIDGSRASHTDTGALTTEMDSGMHGVALFGTTDAKLVDVQSNDTFADGLCIGDDTPYIGWFGGTPTLVQPSRIFVNRCTFDNNRRQGCSIVTGTDMHFNQCGFTNTVGTLPEYGVDIEPDPNQSHQTVRRVYFNGCWFTGNNGRGFGMLIPGQTVDDIVLRDCIVMGNNAEHAIWPNVNNSGILRRFAIIGGYVDKEVRIGQSGVGSARTAKFQGCVIDRLELGTEARVRIENTLGEGRHVTLRGLVAFANTTGELIRLTRTENILIEGCNLVGSTRVIRTITEVAGVTIRGNTLSGSGQQVIAIEGGATDVIISENVVSNAGNHGIDLVTGSRAIVSGNVISDCAQNGLRVRNTWDAVTIGPNFYTGNGTDENLAGANMVRVSTAAV